MSTRLAIDTTALLGAENYRQFLRVFFSSKDQLTKKKLSFAEFSRRANFQSRSYPRDVVVGKRRLTAKTLPQFSRALGLNKQWKEYFRLLVALEEQDALGEIRSREELLAELVRLKEKLLTGSRPRFEFSPQKGELISIVPEIPLVYAALGGVADGIGVEKIALMTGLTEIKVKTTIQEMLKLGLVEEGPAATWRARESHIAISGVKKEVFFQKLFEGAARDALEKSRQLMDTEDNLFFMSALSIRKADMARLKNVLREALLKFVDESEISAGDAVVRLTCAFHV